MRRSLLKLTRLAVTLATQPPAKRSLALAMSSRPESTGTPTASSASSGRPTRSWIRSMSWIIRSSTTSTSVPRSREGRDAVRFDEQRPVDHVVERQQRGIEALEMADLKDPLAAWRRARSGRSASARVVAMGFSTRTCRPPSSRRLATSTWLAGRHHDARGIGKAHQVARIGSAPERPGGSPRLRAAASSRSTTATSRRAGAGGVFLGMMAPEMAAADHRRADRAHAGTGIIAASALCSIRSTSSAMTAASA